MGLDFSRRGRFGLRFLAAGSALALAAPAFAQPAGNEVQPDDEAAAAATTDEDGDEIVVTGFRQSLRAALNQKRDANAIVDVIRAEDIADFPDNNLAESIQRIPGVTITRDQGEGRQITVRGLGPLFTRVRINGMEGLSTTGGADASGGANRSRSFDFNIFASELFNQITVRKSATADVEEGSLGATVDLQTARPFDLRDDLVVAGSVQAGYNDLSDQVDPRLAALFSTQLLDGRLGILVSAAYSTRGIREEGPSTVRWERSSDNGGFNAASTLPTGATAGTAFFHPRIPRYDSYVYDTERLGLTGAIQLRPSDSTLISFDALYARFESQRTEQYLEALSFSRGTTGKPQTVIRPGAIVDSNNSLVSGTFDNVDVRVETRFDELTTEFQQYTASLSQELGERLTFNLLGGYSESSFANPIQTTVALDVANVQGYSYDFSAGRLPAFNYGNLNVEDPSRYTLGEIRLRPQYVDNTFRVVRADLGYELSPSLTLRAGGDYKRYTFDSRELRRASETQVPALTSPQLQALTTLYTISSGTPLPAGTPRTFVVPNLDAFADSLGIYSNTGMFQLFGIENATARSNFRTVRERDLGAFTQLDYNFDLGSVELRGNVGMRYVRTSQTSTGYTASGATLSLVEIERSYDHWLPALNVAAVISDDLILRGAVARVMARPDIGTLNPGGAFSISGGNRTFSRGNPFIEPIEATTYDASIEWYFAPESAIVLGLFYKDISSFISTVPQQIPFNQLGLPESLLAGTNVVPTDIFTVTQPVNGDGGTLKGFEIGVQMPFRFLPRGLDNFGIQANYTFVDSDIDYPLTVSATPQVTRQPLIGLSRHSANATLYYEDRRFSVRGSIAYRSGYLTQVPGRNGNNSGQPTFNDVEGTHGTINVDMAASLVLTENFTLTFEGVNLTDEYVDQYIDSRADRLSTYHHTGRQFYLGARFNF